MISMETNQSPKYSFKAWAGYSQGCEPSESEKTEIINLLVELLTDSELHFFDKMNVCSGITIRSSTPKIWSLSTGDEL